MRLTIDFETRSGVSLDEVGAWNYAMHPSTSVLVLAVAVDHEEPKAWIPPEFRTYVETEISDIDMWLLLDQCADIEAHNISFEISVWDCIMARVYGFPEIPKDKCTCSMARCLMVSIPSSLECASQTLGLDEVKDMEGAKIMTMMRSPLKKTNEFFFSQGYYKKLIDYCKQDVRAERSLSKVLPILPQSERYVQRLDYRMNLRGFTIDRDIVKRFIKVRDVLESEAIVEYKSIVGATPGSYKSLISFAQQHGEVMTSTNASTVASVLSKKSIPLRLRRALELKALASNTSLKKMDKMLTLSDKNGVVRWGFQYYGCSTGRWAGRGVQPQNFVRDVGSDEDFDLLSNPLYGVEDVVAEFGSSSLKTLKSMLRKIIVPRKGHDLYVADFSAIEGRVLAWFAGEDEVLEEYWGEGKMYERAAAAVFKCRKEDIQKGSRERLIGKVCELALGFQGGVDAFSKMGVGYGVEVSEEQAKQIVDNWRASRMKTVRLWRDFGTAAVCAVLNPGKTFLCSEGRVKFLCANKYLCIVIPSGRKLYFYNPYVERNQVNFTTTDKDNKRKAVVRPLYGGLITENIVQAHARDLCVYAMVQLERAGYLPILTVHDEVGAEKLKGTGCIEEYKQIMELIPQWSEGLPVKAEVWKGDRYGKG